MRNDRRFNHLKHACKPAKLYSFAGKKGGLKNGNKYSLSHMAEIAGINPKTLHSRIRAKQCKIVTDYDLRNAAANHNNNIEKPFESRLESAMDMLSQEWLSRRLV